MSVTDHSNELRLAAMETTVVVVSWSITEKFGASGKVS